ncbi:MAG TPA: hypothetical protein VI299_23320 [Polyangiales bacterium]
MSAAHAWRRLIALAIVVGCALLAFIDAPTHAREARAVASPAHTAPSARCRARGTEARLLALSLERSAILDRQRAPFSGVAAQRAEQKMSEAEACYRVAGDRAREARAATLRRRYRPPHPPRPARERDEGWLRRIALAARDSRHE